MNVDLVILNWRLNFLFLYVESIHGCRSKNLGIDVAVARQKQGSLPRPFRTRAVNKFIAGLASEK